MANNNEHICMLSTDDNPFNPFENYESWYFYDNSHCYNSCGLLGSFALTSDSISELDNNIAIEQAINEIVSDTALNTLYPEQSDGVRKVKRIKVVPKR